MPPRDPLAERARARRFEAAGNKQEAGRAYIAAGALADAIRILRGLPDPEVGAQVLVDAGLMLEAAEFLVAAGQTAAGLDRLLRVGLKDPRYREAARQAVELSCALGVLSARFEHFVGAFISAGPKTDADLSALFDLGDLYARKKMPENAEEVFAKIAGRSPEYRDVAKRLSTLRKESGPIGALASRLAEDQMPRTPRPRPAAEAPVAPPAGGAAGRTRKVDAPVLTGSPAVPFAQGSLVADRYRIEDEIGRGGMATVYRAHDLELSEDVALKLFRSTGHDEEAISRFRQELRLSRKLAHRNITRLYDIGVFQAHRYISMELLVGHSLEELSWVPWTMRRGMDYLRQICDALEFAHGQGVIHRDIKPGNLFLSGHGVAKVMDFGIARERTAPGVTQAGMLIGTPEYMSPEQIHGQSANERSDLYSLGVVAYEMFTGQKPFEHADLIPLLQMHVNTPPVPPGQLRPGLSPELEKVILRLLEKDPAKRFPSARALADALAAVIATIPPESGPIAPLGPEE